MVAVRCTTAHIVRFIEIIFINLIIGIKIKVIQILFHIYIKESLSISYTIIFFQEVTLHNTFYSKVPRKMIFD